MLDASALKICYTKLININITPISDGYKMVMYKVTAQNV